LPSARTSGNPNREAETLGSRLFGIAQIFYTSSETDDLRIVAIAPRQPYTDFQSGDMAARQADPDSSASLRQERPPTSAPRRNLSAKAIAWSVFWIRVCRRTHRWRCSSSARRSSCSLPNIRLNRKLLCRTTSFRRLCQFHYLPVHLHFSQQTLRAPLNCLGQLRIVQTFRQILAAIHSVLNIPILRPRPRRSPRMVSTSSDAFRVRSRYMEEVNEEPAAVNWALHLFMA
jgi:hypothetical protein